MRTGILVLLGAAVPVALAAQAPQGACTHRGTAAEIAQRPSPLDSAEATIDGAVVKVCYGRPSARGRAVGGGLVPYGAPWRLGANEPTRLTLPYAADVAGVRVAPGTYSIYVVAGEKSWEVHVNKAVERWGIPIDAAVQAQDVGKGTVPVEAASPRVEQLTLSLEAGPPGALVVVWDTIRVRIPIVKAG